uniref:Putative toxin-antitoxin system toxin component, PIN family n=1 Tax=Candidatus Kentrum sp. FW TaxID=2126338 RepID=A0A450TMQ9_9GAMM|nr:MAG: putative toxin-antitoxin system toxin component, PIN family [Candidatus Kentron sp. FW]
MADVVRVVIDTNHIISAILSSKGASAKLIGWMTKEENYFTLLVSEPIRKEYDTVADWLIPETRHLEKRRIMSVLYSQAENVQPEFRLNACSDESDNRFLECAVAGNADYLVTKNIRHFPPGKYRNVKIVRIGNFLKVLENIARSPIEHQRDNEK